MREESFEFDALGRLTGQTTSTNEPTWDLAPTELLERTFTYTADWTTGVYNRTGPDDQETDVGG